MTAKGQWRKLKRMGDTAKLIRREQELRELEEQSELEDWDDEDENELV